MEAREAAMPGTRPGAAARERRHRGRKRDVFSGVSMAVATVVLLFVGSAIVAIVAGGIAHFGEAVTSAEVLFSLRMSVVTSSISTVLCLVLALPTRCRARTCRSSALPRCSWSSRCRCPTSCWASRCC